MKKRTSEGNAVRRFGTRGTRRWGPALLCALLLVPGAVPLFACGGDDDAGDRVDEAVEEIQDEAHDARQKVEDEARDAKQELEDEIDDHT